MVLSGSEDGQGFPDNPWNSPAFGVSKILFPWQTSGLKAMACNASASATMGQLQSCRIVRRALWAALVRTTPHPKINASAPERICPTTRGSGNAAAQGTVMRSGEYPDTMSAARRGATIIARSAPALRAARALKARQPAYLSLPPAITTRP